MLWFEGSIPAAIISAKEQSSIFVVVITGDDEVSAQMMSSWEDDRVAEASHNCCVAIKVDAKSETCSQFSQIYPVVCIPSSFFIGENGIPLEVVAGSVSAEELMKRIDKVKKMHAQQIAGGGAEAGTPVKACPPAVVASEPAPAQPPSPPAAPATSKESLSRPAEEGGASASVVVTPGEDRSASSDDASTSSQPDGGLDAKVERLTKKLEERREKKKKEGEEGEIKKEMERRKMGKEMLDYKRKNEDEKTKRIMDERSREKAEEKAARERVKAQIALDRADRAARYANNQEEVEAARLAALQARQAEAEAKKEIAHRERSAIARIQFRLPDGSFFTTQFSSEARLNEARQFAVNEVGNRYGNFSLATMFPRREFTADDLGKTLLELELAPGASIVLLPQTGRPNNTVVQSSSGGGIWAVLGTILYPLLAVWRFLSGFLFTSPPTPGAAGPRGPAQQPNTNSGSGSSPSAEPKRETLRKRTLEKQPVDFKRDGKIHRLRNHQDSEDENNTWNGNSTQQM
ncbi:UBX domain-containing protein 4 isoform X1 [Salmo salar]|uniref:UBX domain-containing protein 4 n=1 Tax=Salmo salar TaxID=8030 RepID=A0A1S3P059_SALSA|nr:UBX domain-containing protein 4 isoform X1 [Salmo salar]|eukprot:XP_014020920.1 PREDICTED: UBX domain-containing protein 4 isoform X1 [Salmo salar]